MYILKKNYILETWQEETQHRLGRNSHEGGKMVQI